MKRISLAVLSLAILPSVAGATTYQVGPSRAMKTPNEALAMLAPGDVLEIDGDHTYTGGLIFDEPGTEAQKITVRGVRVNGKRPVFTGGGNVIEARASHYVFEGLDITNGTNRCFYHHADDITLRDAVVHDCPKQGILGADTDSGTFLLEYTEVYGCGGGTQDHQIYMATDPTVYPGSVFRMQFCYVHDANGGNNVKSRAARNEIYYNWIEGALYHEVECIGSDGAPEDAVREDSDIVGNVLVKRTDFAVTRFGGDGTGQTNGRYRFVNNTVVVAGDDAVFRLFDGIESLEAHNNVFASAAMSTVNLVREVEASWVTGSTTIAGQNNWVQMGATNVPATWTGTIQGAAPAFVALASNDFRLTDSSPLVDVGAATLTGPSGHEFPSPLPAPLYLPPARTALALGSAEGRNTVGTIDVGAFELGGGGAPPTGGTNPPGGGTNPPGGGTNPPGGGEDEGGCAIARGSARTPGVPAALAVVVVCGALLRRRRVRRA